MKKKIKYLFIFLISILSNAQSSENISELNSYFQKVTNIEDVSGGFSKNLNSGVYIYEIKRVSKLTGITVSKCVFQEKDIKKLYEYINDEPEYGLSLYRIRFNDTKCSYTNYDDNNNFNKRTTSDGFVLSFNNDQTARARILLREVFPNTNFTEDKTSENINLLE